MSTAEAQTLPAPPNLVASILAGFDAITNHVGLILFPVFLDLFLWLGPHLRLANLIEKIIALLSNLPAGASGLDPAQSGDILRLTSNFWMFVGERFNLFSVLRTYPVGVPSLISGNQPVFSPLGQPLMWNIEALGVVLTWWVLLNLVGLALGCLYFQVVAQAVLQGEVDWPAIFRRWPQAAGQSVLLMLFWGLLLVGFSVPASCFLSLFTTTGAPVGRFGLLIFGGLLLWMIFPLFFSAHGIFVYGAGVVGSVRESVRVTRLTMPKTAFLFLVFFLISEGLGVVWRIPEDDSWMALVGVIGHAFVATSLLAASFLYYRDASRWVKRLIQQAKFSMIA